VRIALSLLAFRPGRIGGAETYVRALVEWLPAVAGDDELLLVVDRDGSRGLAAPGWRKVVVPASARGVVGRRILEAYTPWRDRQVTRILDGLAADVVLFPQQSIYPARTRTPAVLTAVDVQYLFHPENFGLFDRTFRPRVYPRSLEAARHVIAISEFTRGTLVETCGVPAGKVTAVPLGFTPRDVSGVVPRREDAPYLYYPAASFPHKGHDDLFRALAALRRDGALRHRLLLTGARTAHWPELERLARELGIADAVTHLGFVPREAVASLYAGADAVVFPSRYEGFGLPVVEAAQFGRRLVTSRLPVFDEIGVPAEAQIDFADAGALAAALARPGPTRLLVAPLTWREVAARTLDVLRRAGANGGRRPGLPGREQRREAAAGQEGGR
jgi:glycosyltransferase involved in cell wall biosynthesis